jgi:uncharacterized membrane protein
VASINLLIGFALLLFGVIFGLTEWIVGAVHQTPASPGTVMLAALPVIIGSQLLLSFLSFDMANVPREPLHAKIRLHERRR